MMLLPRSATADLTARYDDRCDAMVAEPPGPETLLAGAPQPYFLRPVPKRVILVQLCGSADAEHTAWLAAWRNYANAFQYSVEEIHAVAAVDASGPVGQGLIALATQELAAGHCQEATDLLRWMLLAEQGGIAADASMYPPAARGTAIDFAQLMPMHGLVLLAGAKPHNTKRAPQVSGLAVDARLVLASPEHPVLQALVATVQANHASVRAVRPDAEAAYTTGSVLLTRMLSGSFTVLPRSFLELSGEHHGS